MKYNVSSIESIKKINEALTNAEMLLRFEVSTTVRKQILILQTDSVTIEFTTFKIEKMSSFLIALSKKIDINFRDDILEMLEEIQYAA